MPVDWTFWVGGAVIVLLVIVTQVFLHESRWSQRWRPEETDEPEPAARPAERDEPDHGPDGATLDG